MMSKGLTSVKVELMSDYKLTECERSYIHQTMPQVHLSSRLLAKTFPLMIWPFLNFFVFKSIWRWDSTLDLFEVEFALIIR